MKLNKNDPRLTAYVLNELSDADRILVAHAIQNDPEIKSEIELLQKTISFLNENVSQANEQSYRLNPSQREKVFKRRSSIWNWWPVAGGMVTAGLALMLVMKNPASTDSSALLEQERMAKQTQFQDAALVAEAPAPSAEKAAAPAPQAEEAKATQDLARGEGAGIPAASAPAAPIEAPKMAMRERSVEPEISKAGDGRPNANSKVSLGSRPSGLQASRGVAPKKDTGNQTKFSFVAEPQPASQALDSEIAQEVLPRLQNCLQQASDSFLRSDIILTVRLSLQDQQVTQIWIDGAEDSQLIDCLKARHSLKLQNAGSLRDYSYKLKILP